MADLTARDPFSFRHDPTVPDFDDRGPIAVMDGTCSLCSWGARTIARRDRAGVFRICPVQSPLGTALVRHYGLDPDDPETWLLIDGGTASSGMEAIIRIGTRLGGIARVAGVMRILPRPVRDWIYRRVARNRFRFGTTDMCTLPDPELVRRIIM